MKLALVAALPPGGAPESGHALRLAEALGALGHEVHALAGVESRELSVPGLTVHASMRDWTWRDLPRLAGFLRRTRPDALILHYVGWAYGAHPMVTLAPGLARALGRGTRTATCLTSWGGASLRAWLRPAGRPGRGVPRGLETGSGAAGAAPAPAPVPAPGTGQRPPRLLRALSFGRLDARFGTIFSASDRIVVLSEAHRAVFAAYEPRAAGKLAVVPPGPAIRLAPAPDPDARRRSREGLGAAPEDFLLVYLGFVYPGKGLETLLRAMKELAVSESRSRLVLAGGVHPTAGAAHLASLRALADELGVAGRVTWTGGFDWDSPAPSEWLRAADACVLPFDAGLQLNNSSFAAAAAHELPVISTRGAGTEPAFADGENVRLCPPRDPGALAAAVRELANDAELRGRLGRGALDLAAKRLSWRAIAGQFMELLGRPARP